MLSAFSDGGAIFPQKTVVSVLCNFKLQIIHMPQANQFSDKLVFCIF